MKKIFILVVGLLFIGINVYAAGDLVVNGKLGIGTTPLAPKATLVSTNMRGLSVGVTTNTNNAGGLIYGGRYSVTIDGTTSTDSITGQEAVLDMMSDLSGTVPGGEAAAYSFQIGTPDSAGSTTVTKVVGLQYMLNRHYANTRTYNVTDSYGFLSLIQDGGPTGTAINVTNHYHQYLDDPGVLSKVNINNLYGMFIEKMTAGTNNYGLVLDGNGAGADIVMGPNQETRIYSAQEVTPTNQYVGIWVKDSGGNATQISPHDPETGEWIYYSKNVTTGRTVRVNMEKLVKAVEKLTGEKFMVETLMEDK